MIQWDVGHIVIILHGIRLYQNHDKIMLTISLLCRSADGMIIPGFDITENFGA